MSTLSSLLIHSSLFLRFNIVQSCWYLEPEDRPSFSDIVRSLCVLIRRQEEQQGDSDDNEEEGANNVYFVLENNSPDNPTENHQQVPIENDPTVMLYAEIEQANEVPPQTDDLYAVIASQDVLSTTVGQNPYTLDPTEPDSHT